MCMQHSCFLYNTITKQELGKFKMATDSLHCLASKVQIFQNSLRLGARGKNISGKCIVGLRQVEGILNLIIKQNNKTK